MRGDDRAHHGDRTRVNTETSIEATAESPDVVLLAAVIETVDAGVLVCDRAGRFILQNRVMRAMLGGAQDARSVQDMIDRGCFFHADGVTPISFGDSAMVGAVEGRVSTDLRVVLRNTENPEGRHLRITACPLVVRGQNRGAVVAAHDMSREHRADRELSRHKVVLESVLECVAEAVVVFDAEGDLMLANPAFDRLIGRSPPAGTAADDSLARYGRFTVDGTRRLDPREGPEFRALRGEKVDQLEFLVRRPGLRDTVVSCNAELLRDPTGSVLGVVVTGRDITDRKLAEQDLLDQKALLASILDCLGEGVLVYDRAGRIVLQNPAAERLIDPAIRKSSTLLERTAHYGLFTIDGAESFPLDRAPATRALAGLPSDDVEILVRSQAWPEGVPISANGRPLLDAHGTVTAGVVTLRDITSRRRMEQDREAILRELRRSNEELAQFAYVASHDLRSPLRAIDMLAGWIEEDLAPHFTEESAKQIALLRGRVRRMDALLRDLLEFSRLDRAEVEMSLVNVDDLIGEVIDLVGPLRGFRITRVVTAASLKTVAVRLKRALLNLVTNAIKHHDRSAGEVRIVATDHGDFVDFDVIDDGPGIPAQFHQKIFEMFQTLKPRDVVEGNGMGLSLVKKLAETAGGSISVASRGRGSTFRLRWPRLWLRQGHGDDGAVNVDPNVL